MSPDAGIFCERGVVFEEASGYRWTSARRVFLAAPVLFESLCDVDLAVRISGATLLGVLRFDREHFDEEQSERLRGMCAHAGGALFPLDELPITERAQFLARMNQCVHRRLRLAPERLTDHLDQLAQVVERAATSDRRASERYETKVPATVAVEGTFALEGELRNLSRGGAFVTTPATPVPLKAKLQLEFQVGATTVQSSGVVVSKSAEGVGVEFFEASTRARSLVEAIESVAPAAPAPATSVQSAAQSAPVQKLGPYELLSLIGKGGMGEVFFARAVQGPLEGQSVALKRLHARQAKDAGAVASLRLEARVLARVTHPNIIRTLDAGHVEGQDFLVMELVDGRDLGQVLRRSRSRKVPLSLDVACGVVEAVLDALSAVHDGLDEDGTALSLVHCDVSPENVFVGRGGEVKLGDFGLARRAGSAMSDASSRGRPPYLSPELLDGDVTVQADLWATAVTLWELVTLERPFVGETLEQLTRSIFKGKERDVRELRADASAALAEVLGRALHKNPKQRYSTAAEFAHALSECFVREKGDARSIADEVARLFAALKAS